jgi:hypothetical protein
LRCIAWWRRTVIIDGIGACNNDSTTPRSCAAGTSWKVDMDKKLFVIGIAIMAVLLTTWLQVLIRKHGAEPESRKLLWTLLAGGLIALAGVAGLVASGW